MVMVEEEEEVVVEDAEEGGYRVLDAVPWRV